MTMYVTPPSGGTFVIGAKPAMAPMRSYAKEARRKTYRDSGGPERDKSRHTKRNGGQAKPNRSRR